MLNISAREFDEMLCPAAGMVWSEMCAGISKHIRYAYAVCGEACRDDEEKKHVI